MAGSGWPALAHQARAAPGASLESGGRFFRCRIRAVRRLFEMLPPQSGAPDHPNNAAPEKCATTTEAGSRCCPVILPPPMPVR